MNKPVIIDVLKDCKAKVDVKDILKPKVAKAKKMTQEQVRMMEAYKLFQNKYVK